MADDRSVGAGETADRATAAAYGRLAQGSTAVHLAGRARAVGASRRPAPIPLLLTALGHNSCKSYGNWPFI